MPKKQKKSLVMGNHCIATTLDLMVEKSAYALITAHNLVMSTKSEIVVVRDAP